MSFDWNSEVKCAWCSTWICLGLDYEIRQGDEMHVACAAEWDKEHGPHCTCGHSYDSHDAYMHRCFGQKDCKCRQYEHATGEDPKDHDPTEAELTAMNGPQ